MISSWHGEQMMEVRGLANLARNHHCGGPNMSEFGAGSGYQEESVLAAEEPRIEKNSSVQFSQEFTFAHKVDEAPEYGKWGSLGNRCGVFQQC